MHREFKKVLKQMLDDDFEELVNSFVQNLEEEGEPIPEYCEETTAIYKDDYTFGEALKNGFFPDLTDEEYWDIFRKTLEELGEKFYEDEDGFEIRRLIILKEE